MTPIAIDASPGVVTVQVHESRDLVVARAEVMRLSAEGGFRHILQVQIATAASELARNMLLYAEGGTFIVSLNRRGIRMEALDKGPGIPPEKLEEILSGTYVSRTGMGKGLIGTKKLMDTFSIISIPGRTQIVAEKHFR